MKNPLLDSPVSRAGCAVATALVLVIGAPLSTGRIRVVGDLIVCTGLPRWVFGRGGTTVGRVYLTRDNDGDDVLEHEAVHVRQWQRYGLLMPILYAIAGRDPHTNRFEVEAGLEKGGYR
ncbi:Fe-S oxidoreductase [Frondihabitans australicus]|uniref:Fe-S oxidoreductase n=1 Tax=Frondihabitans australicus TaxID=386892 RepID=A0A495ICP8_9MICO|nr:Fe-S oxidoreductase [Frondihabitans australicus]RKR73777.1 hypothetical protein C8E83_0873 [Frondihabitans australicus]